MDWLQLNLTNYPEVIKTPMDLGTIYNKLFFNVYGDPEEFKCDMQLIFNNCILYNGEYSELGVLATNLNHEFFTMYTKKVQNTF